MRALLLLLAAQLAHADGHITIERATVPWNELERLLRKEGAAPPPRSAPRAFAVPSLEVFGELDASRVQLHLTVEVEVLAERWTVAPILPAHLAVSHATVEAPSRRRGLLVRDPGGVSLAADGAGRYRVQLEVEGALDKGHLVLSPNGLAGGYARLTLAGLDNVGGRTPWRTHLEKDGSLVAEAALGPFGLDLALGTAPAVTPKEAGASIEDLDAITVLSLGGSGVTRLNFSAAADESGVLEVTLPKGARLWKLYVGGSAIPVGSVGKAESLRLPVKRYSKIELAFTFEAPPLGIRGRYHLELPRLPVPARGAHWDVWLPGGLSYTAPQAALSPSTCAPAAPTSGARPRTPITPVGTCLGLERPVLPSGAAYIEGKYDQPL